MLRVFSSLVIFLFFLTSTVSLAGERRRILKGEKRFRAGGAQTSVDFGEQSIVGDIKHPGLTAVGATQTDKNYDFIRLRLRWHPEMVRSASALSR